MSQSWPTLCNPVDCSLPGSSVHCILQARILQWVAISFFRGSSQPRDWTWFSCIAGRFFNVWTIREATFQFWFFSHVLTNLTHLQPTQPLLIISIEQSNMWLNPFIFFFSICSVTIMKSPWGRSLCFNDFLLQAVHRTYSINKSKIILTKVMHRGYVF